MPGRSSRADELDALGAALSAASAAPRRAPEAAADPLPDPAFEEARRVLADLAEAAGDAAVDARRFALDHPLATVSAAFLLGLALGAAWRAR